MNGIQHIIAAGLLGLIAAGCTQQETSVATIEESAGALGGELTARFDELEAKIRTLGEKVRAGGEEVRASTREAVVELEGDLVRLRSKIEHESYKVRMEVEQGFVDGHALCSALVELKIV